MKAAFNVRYCDPGDGRSPLRRLFRTERAGGNRLARDRADAGRDIFLRPDPAVRDRLEGETGP